MTYPILMYYRTVPKKVNCLCWHSACCALFFAFLLMAQGTITIFFLQILSDERPELNLRDQWRIQDFPDGGGGGVGANCGVPA